MIGMKDEESEIMQQLLYSVNYDHDERFHFSTEEREKIIKLGDAWEDTPLTEQRKQQDPEWIRTSTAEELWQTMLLKMVEAPTTLHMVASIKVIVPAIAEKLKQEDIDGGVE